MEFLGLTQNVKDLTNKEVVTQIVDVQGGKIDTISVDGVQQAIVNKNVNIDLSGKADKTAVPEKEIENANGKAQILNESDGGGIFFIRNDNTRKSFVGVNDSTAGGPDAQIYAIDPSNSNFGAKVDILKDGIYYTVGSDSYVNRIAPENELAAKRDVNAINYEIKKLDTAETGYLATYQLIDKDGNVKGASINIAKDLVISKVELKTCTQDNVPVEGYRVGDKYIDFTINTLSGQDHIYLLVKELVDIYKADESTLTLDASTNTFSIKQAYTDAINDKFDLADNKIAQEATLREAGDNAVSAAKLDKMPGDEYTGGNAYNLPYYFYTVPAADKVEVHTKTVTLDGNKTQGDYSLDVNSATTSQAGLMSANDKSKLDSAVQPADITNMATMQWVDQQGFLKEHQDITGKVDKPVEPVAGQGVNVPYFFDVAYAADKAVVRDYTVDLLNKSKAPGVYSLDIAAATDTTAGLMTADDKVKLDSAITSHQDISGKVDKPFEPVAGQGVNIPYYFDVVYGADKATVRDYTVDLLDRTKAPQQFSLDINAATTEKAGLMTATDKAKVDAAITSLKTVNNESLTGNGDIATAKIVSIEGNSGTFTDEQLVLLQYNDTLIKHGSTIYRFSISDAAYRYYYRTPQINLITLSGNKEILDSIWCGYVIVNTTDKSWSISTYRPYSARDTYDATTSLPMSGIAVAEAISNKQDIISDLETIRSGAALGATSIQEHQSLVNYSTTTQMNTAISNALNTPSDISVTNAVGTYQAGDTIPAGTSIFTIIQNMLTASV